jgi:hypothetical protein
MGAAFEVFLHKFFSLEVTGKSVEWASKTVLADAQFQQMQ